MGQSICFSAEYCSETDENRSGTETAKITGSLLLKCRPRDDLRLSGPFSRPNKIRFCDHMQILFAFHVYSLYI